MACWIHLRHRSKIPNSQQRSAPPARARSADIVVPFEAGKSRDLISQGSPDIIGPRHSAKGITVMADLDAGEKGRDDRRRLSGRNQDNP
jgi:hypothetical protein